MQVLNTAKSALVEQNFIRSGAGRLKAMQRDVPSLVGLFQCVFEGEGSPRQAIKALCLDWKAQEGRTVQ